MKSKNTSDYRSVFFFLLATLLILNCYGIGLAQKNDSESSSQNSENTDAANVLPLYQIFDITSQLTGFTASQGFGISPGGVATGRIITNSGSQNFVWQRGAGPVGYTNLANRSHCVGNSTNQISAFGGGSTVGTCSTTLFGSSRLPVIWNNLMPAQLPLPAGETLGDANAINSSGIVVGSVNGGSLQKAVYYSNNAATLISQTTSNGSYFVTAFGVNNSNRIVGSGIDPNNAARNVGMVYDIGSSSAFEVGALPNANGALAFAIGNGGHIVGSSMLNQGAGLPFIWTQAGGIIAIPLPSGTTQGSARGVNSAGWAVGTASSAFAIPFLYDGAKTYRLQDLIPTNSGWDLSMNTSSSAMGISDNGYIVGTGVLNGQTRAYVMVPIMANVSLSGRVTTSDGRGIPNVRLTISGGNLTSPKSAITSPFGYYKFEELQTEMPYTVTISSKIYTFGNPTRTITLSGGSITNNNYTAQ